ncbi:putative HTH-type transcriptional regulator YtdP [Flavobacteriaceae bacterium UJ101]|nr:putative HTH-type transcriptional regulator YtdP [Flavobacteriaceae bacterium UJ101]
MPRTIINDIVIQHYKNSAFFEFCEYTNIRFFEIIHFKKGTGTIKINNKSLSYEPNSLFVMVPNDIYTIEVNSSTTLTTIKFLKNFFNRHHAKVTLNTHNWLKQVSNILNNDNQELKKLKFQTESDKESFISLINIVQTEYENKKANNLIIINHSLSILLHIITRNIRNSLVDSPPKTTQSSKIQDIIDYIHTHIYEPELLLNKKLATEFNIAENYFGQYFKKQMGISVKKYILNYKLKLVEARLKYTDMQLSEIALELGFTDASHLNKTFYTYNGVSIKDYKLKTL